MAHYDKHKNQNSRANVFIQLMAKYHTVAYAHEFLLHIDAGERYRWLLLMLEIPGLEWSAIF